MLAVVVVGKVPAAAAVAAAVAAAWRWRLLRLESDGAGVRTTRPVMEHAQYAKMRAS